MFTVCRIWRDAMGRGVLLFLTCQGTWSEATGEARVISFRPLAETVARDFGGYVQAL